MLQYQNPNLKNKKEEAYLVDFFKKLFCIDPKKRLNLDEMFSHPLFQVPETEETSDSTVDDQLEQDVEWEV